MELLDDDAVINKLKAWYDDPILFTREILHLEPDEQQQEVIYQFYNGKKRTSIKSGRGCGKTYVASIITWHFLCTRANAQIYLTAPAGGTISGALWPTLAKIHDNMEDFFKDQFDFLSQKITHKEYPHSWFAMARTARREQPEALAGSHARNMMFLCDEASGIEDPVFNAIFGSLTEEDNYLLMLSNPRRLKGFFYNSFRPINANIYNQLTMSAIKSRFVTKESIQHWKNLYGEESNQYKIEVLGQFPDTDTEAIIPAEAVENAVNREGVDHDEIPIFWGLDVSEGTDKSVLIKRQGSYVFDGIRKWKLPDTMMVVSRVNEEYINTPDELKPERIYVDPIGVGKGAYDRMKQIGLPVYPANAAHNAVNKKFIFNNKAEWWLNMKKWFIYENPRIPNDRFLIDQLMNVRSIPSMDGRFKVEQKQKYRERNMGQSPDEADALALTFNQKSKKTIGIVTY